MQQTRVNPVVVVVGGDRPDVLDQAHLTELVREEYGPDVVFATVNPGEVLVLVPESRAGTQQQRDDNAVYLTQTHGLPTTIIATKETTH